MNTSLAATCSIAPFLDHCLPLLGCAANFAKRPLKRPGALAAVPRSRGPDHRDAGCRRRSTTCRASLTVIRGEDSSAPGGAPICARRSQRSRAVDAPPGGDTGPAGKRAVIVGDCTSSTAFPARGRRGCPGAARSNPAVPTLDLNDVERIEIMKGAAPVMFGATSFVGVIHVIRYPAGEERQRAERWRRQPPPARRVRCPRRCHSSGSYRHFRAS